MPNPGTSAYKRAETARRAAISAIEDLPEGKQNPHQLSLKLELNTSTHLTWLLRDHFLSPALERAMVFHGLLEARPEPVPAEPCHVCGEVHRLDYCTHIFGEPPTPKNTAAQRARRKRRPRISVAADDPVMALRQLERYYPGMFSLNVQEIGNGNG